MSLEINGKMRDAEGWGKGASKISLIISKNIQLKISANGQGWLLSMNKHN